jgi:hypothetical protein
MPKVAKNNKLSRVARRVAASHPLPTSATVVKEKQVTNYERVFLSVGPKDDHDDDKDEANNTSQSLSRGQRKRQAKRDQYLKKEKMILSTLMLKKQDEQKKRIDGLDAIREALLDTTKNTETKEEPVAEEHNPTYGSNRSRKGLMSNEIERMGLVMEHPAFKQNPFEAIQEHLKNTLAQQKEKRDQDAKKKTEQDRVKKEVKKQEKKERLQGVKRGIKKYKPRNCR